MTETSWPYVNQPTTDTEYSRLFREFTDDAVVWTSDQSGLRAYGDASGMYAKVNAGAAILRGFMYQSTAAKTLTIDPSTAQPRIDRVILELNVASADFSTRIVMKVLKGTPAAFPAAPALAQLDTGVFQVSLARVNVGQGVTQILSGDVVDERRFSGENIGIWSTANRPVGKPGLIGFNLNLKRLECTHDGTTWFLLNSPSWYDINNIPATFNPSAHTHNASDIITGDLHVSTGWFDGNLTALGGLTKLGATSFSGDIDAGQVHMGVATLTVGGATSFNGIVDASQVTVRVGILSVFNSIDASQVSVGIGTLSVGGVATFNNTINAQNSTVNLGQINVFKGIDASQVKMLLAVLEVGGGVKMAGIRNNVITASSTGRVVYIDANGNLGVQG